MTCTDIEERQVAEAYLLARLTEDEREAYERHYFECARCYSELEALRTVRDALGYEHLPTSAFIRRRPPASAFVRRWVALAAGVAIAIGGAIGWRAHVAPTRPAATSLPAARQYDRAGELAQLSAVTPPPYEPRQLRGPRRSDEFVAGMSRYSAGDYAGAIPLLRRAAGQEPTAEDTRFYLGASLLLAGMPADAVAVLQPLTSATTSAYREEAAFLTAKAFLRAGDVQAANVALDKTLAMHGDLEQEAVRLQARLATMNAR